MGGFIFLDAGYWMLVVWVWGFLCVTIVVDFFPKDRIPVNTEVPEVFTEVSEETMVLIQTKNLYLKLCTLCYPQCTLC